jgi:hypothetical protein
METTTKYPLISDVQRKVKAFMLLETQYADRSHIVNLLGTMPGVVSIDGVKGIYDVIAVLEGNTLDEIGNLVVSKMDSIIRDCRYQICLVTPELSKGSF